jgi:hypothetical protein
MEQAISLTIEEYRKARFVRRKILQHKRRFRNKRHQQQGIGGPSVIFSHPNRSPNDTVTSPLIPTNKRQSNVQSNRRSLQSSSPSAQDFSPLPMPPSPMLTSHNLMDCSAKFINTPSTIHSQRFETPKITDFNTYSNSVTPTSNTFNGTKLTGCSINKENSSSTNPISKRMSQVAKNNTPLANITSNYVNRHREPAANQTTGFSKKNTRPGVFGKARTHLSSLNVNLANKFNESATSHTNNPTYVATQVDIPFDHPIGNKRTQANISSPHEELQTSDHTDSSDVDEFENQSDSESDDDVTMSAVTDPLSGEPLGINGYFVLRLPKYTYLSFFFLL